MEDIIKTHKMYKMPDLSSTWMITAANGVPDGMYPGNASINFVTGYYMKNMPYYHDERLLEYAYESLCMYEKFLHEDGSADLAVTNFHDPAQTGFHAQGILVPAILIEKYTEHTPLEDKLFAKYLELMKRMGDAMATLGFHTPNHRWVICSGLSVVYHFIKDPKYKETIDKLLMEGIDCDECGKFTERSTGVYNVICDFSFLLWAEFSGDDSYYCPVRRNLNLMFHFTEPDGTINTLNSTRWDMGGAYSIAKYYPYYMLLALRDENPEFAYMADTYYDEYIKKYGQHFYYFIIYSLLHPEEEAKFEKIPLKAPEKNQTIFLPNSRIARVYKPELKASITALCTRHPVFCQLNYGSSIVQFRYAGSFFGDPHSPFRARQIEEIEDGFRLIGDEKAGYRSTLAEKPETSDWRKMDHSKRDTINIQKLHREVDIHILEDGIRFDFRANGCDAVPTKFEIILPIGGNLMTESITMVPKASDYAYLNGNAKYFINATQYFEIEGGFMKHTYGDGMRGTFPSDAKNFTLAVTEFTPQESSVTIRMKHLFDEIK
jgi:hypothetical protein